MPSFRPIQELTITGGAAVTIDLTQYVDSYYIKGGTEASPVVLASGYEITTPLTPQKGMRVKFEYNAFVTSSESNKVTLLGTAMPIDYTAKKVNVDCYFDGTDWIVDYQPAFDQADIITTNHIKAANVTLAKLEAVTAGSILMGNSSNRPAATAITGAIAITNAGVSSIVPDTIVDADIKSDAAIATSKLAASADIAKLATVTKAELEYNAGVTAGTAAASKAVVLNASKKIDELDATVLKINGTTVEASAAELSQLNSAGVLKADFEVLEDLAANGVTKSDLALLAGAEAAGVTTADIQGIVANTPQRVQVKTDTVITNATIDNATGLVVLTVIGDTTLTLPSGTSNTKQVIDIIILKNEAGDDVIFVDTDSDFYNGGVSSSNTTTVTAPVAGSIIKVANVTENLWVIGTAATYVVAP